MNSYRVNAPHFVAGIIVTPDDLIIQAAPILGWTVGKNFPYVRDYCRSRGWIIEPLPQDSQPRWLEVEGQCYEIVWRNGVIARITLHEGNEPKDLSFDELPECLKKLL